MKEMVNKEEFENFVIKINTSKDFSTQSVYITIRDTWLAAEEAFLEKQKEVRCENCKYEEDEIYPCFRCSVVFSNHFEKKDK